MTRTFHLTFQWRKGNPAIWEQPVTDTYLRMGWNPYCRQISYRPGSLIISLPGFIFTRTRIL